MLYGMYVSAAGALANAYRNDVVANNLANVETVAFKRDLALFQSRATEASSGGRSRDTAGLLEGIGGGVFALPTHTDFTPAALEKTDDPFDVALAGRGFFSVGDGSGVQYTRDGRFLLNEAGRLVTRSGDLAVLDDSGEPIVLDGDLDFSVNEAGVISQGGAEVARLAAVDFRNARDLEKVGENLYKASDGATSHESHAVVKQHHLEMSGVNAVQSMTEMMKASRMFEANMSMLKLQDQTLGAALTRFGSLS